jgi:hypothetical protein
MIIDHYVKRIDSLSVARDSLEIELGHNGP